MRITTLDEVLFPVEMRSVCFMDGKGAFRSAASHQVIVDAKRDVPVGVVGRGYRLVTNAQAVEYARQCAKQVFGTERAENLEVFNVYAPGSRWGCCVDLIHKGYEVNFFKSEVYLPFVRVTNSYNGTRALRFDVGYCRKVCMNGMLFEQESIRFAFSHSGRGLGMCGLNFSVGQYKLERLQRSFQSDAERLHAYQVPEGMELPLFFQGLQLPVRVEGDQAIAKAELIQALELDAQQRIERYFRELGRNGYALLNAMTDFATRPPTIKNFRKTAPAMQAAVGKWTQQFTPIK